MGKHKNKLPDKWLEYKPYNDIVYNTNIIPFKTPFNKNISDPDIDSWKVENVIEKIPNLGAVIDLTNTYRYYDSNEFKNKGIIYKKLKLKGQTIPSDNAVISFMKIINSINNLIDKDKLIGVHCTHGINRTGYLICRYIKNVQKIDTDTALEYFKKARGYEIRKDEYIQKLYLY
ncbi:protein tyrosine phosphatase 1 [Mythimna separata entomopoxvirus 'L']|uniref:Protein tyrosine phosphatase 1 n=1 Tax=Mythimna separata entomopoxvirus 'L' TaxID=1293572 RepID=A0A916P1J2_9POXV|nr:protein tyrosine phosphatase 1 [Mythimna separata entomopoxvirus 'L']CCU56367.1 protein tyrosine phosphatase 1 [Mythimna separata entomopoxvirus 'L']